MRAYSLFAWRLFGLALLMAIAGISMADEQALAEQAGFTKPDTFATITIENDLFVGVDGGYTNGVGYSWGHGPYRTLADTDSPDWLQTLGKTIVLHDDKDHLNGVSYSLFQGMQTPADISDPNLIIDDLPYAGIAGWQGTLYSWTERKADQFNLILGVVGPVSLAEKTQKAIHKITGSEEPMGWDNQLHNEPVFALQARRSWRHEISNGDGHGWDFIGMIEAGAGNYRSHVAGTLLVRWGLNLQRSHAAIGVLPGRGINPLAGTYSEEYYAFIGVQPQYVFNDIMVVGNTFRSSHSVTLENERMVYSAGVVWNWRDWGVILSLAETSNTFEEKKGRARFGSISISYRL